jgi:hypothetical protein
VISTPTPRFVPRAQPECLSAEYMVLESRSSSVEVSVIILPSDPSERPDAHKTPQTRRATKCTHTLHTPTAPTEATNSRHPEKIRLHFNRSCQLSPSELNLSFSNPILAPPFHNISLLKKSTPFLHNPLISTSVHLLHLIKHKRHQ